MLIEWMEGTRRCLFPCEPNAQAIEIIVMQRDAKQ
jgi:hypothetical protein